LKNLQRHNLREGLKKMAGTPGWAMREEDDFLATRSPGLESLGNDVWAAATPRNLARARAFFGAQPFNWLLEEGRDGSLLAAAGAPEPEAIPEMVLPLREAPAWEPPRGIELARAESDLEFREWSAIVSRTFGLEPENTRAFFRALQRTAGFIPFLARIDRQPAGTAMVFPGATGAGIFAVATREEYRRRGLGSALTRACLREARTGGGEWAVLYSSPEGRPLYERLGFRPAQVVREYRMPGLEPAPAVREVFPFPLGEGFLGC
jgi:ribosomal protein S18 acetylase RimI-like enzyme